MKKLLPILAIALTVLLVTPAQADNLDQSNSTGGTSIGFGQAANIKYSCQGFRPTYDQVTAVSIDMDSVGSQGLLIWIDAANANSAPTGTLEVGLGSMEIPNSQLSTSLKKFTFSTPIAVTPESQYTFCMAPWNTTSHAYADSYRNFNSSVSNPYSRGKMAQYSGGVWSNNDSGNGDRVFEVYGEWANNPTWTLQSVDVMKSTKDNICTQSSTSTVNSMLDKIVEIGANYVAVSGYYDNPPCADATAYLGKWVTLARGKGLKVWFRMKDLKFEGDYSQTKTYSPDGMRHQKMMVDWIAANNLVQNGDIFTPNAEPQNGGINSVTSCGSLCQFSGKDDFNIWLKQIHLLADLGFKAKGLTGVKVGYYGFDGFITAGIGNPNWQGQSQLEPSTIALMGNVAIDHYPETIGHTLAQDLPTIKQAIGSTTPIIISEYGSITTAPATTSIDSFMSAAAGEPNIQGFNYWTLGPAGNEALINSDFTNRPGFGIVESYFK